MKRTEGEQTFEAWADDVESAAQQITGYTNKMRKHRHDPDRLQLLIDSTVSMYRAAFAIRELLKKK